MACSTDGDAACGGLVKRFWTVASVSTSGGVHAILLDGRPMRVPGGTPLALRSLVLAEAIAEEWQRAGGEVGARIDPRELPLTTLASTVQDRIAPDRSASAEALAAYAAIDLLCYRAASPAALVAREEVAWQPWLDWADQRLGARLLVTAGVMPVVQPAAATGALRDAVLALSPEALGALGVVVPATGSLVLGLAFAAGALEIGQVFALAMLDELFQAELWGSDPGALARRTRIREDLEGASRFLRLALR